MYYIFLVIQIEPAQFCESYVECEAVALLEERLCLGNSRLRPYWLPSSKDKNNCHDKLRNDYLTLDKMEGDLDEELTGCLIQHISPLSSNQTCNSDTLRSARKFSFGRTITYVPSQCFTGTERRRERECKRVKDCCPSVSKCLTIRTDSQLAKSIESLRIKMRERAKNCENGLEISSLPSPGGDQNDYAQSIDNKWSPSGNINVHFSNVENDDQNNKEYDSDTGKGSVNVHFTTKDENVNDETNPYNPETDQNHYQRPKPIYPAIVHREGDQKKNTESGRPKLSFPGDDKTAVYTNDGIIVVNFHHNEDNPRISETRKSLQNLKSVAEHVGDEQNRGREQLQKLNEADAAQVGLESLLKAEQVFDGITGRGSIASLRQVNRGQVEHLEPIASGSVRSLEMMSDDDDGVDDHHNGNIVTSAPVIFVGDKKHHDIKELIDEWQNKFKTTEEKDKEMKREIIKGLAELIDHFDRVNLQLIGPQVATTNSVNEFEKECYPMYVKIAESSKTENDKTVESNSNHRSNHSNATVLTDEHGDQIVLEDGVENLILSSGGASIGLSIDSDETKLKSDEEHNLSERKIIHNWSNEDYKRELEKYKNDHHINTTRSERNETSCDLYMRCRNQMHLAVDSCAWRFASSKILPTLAESVETLLYKFSSSICIPYSSVEHVLYNSALMRLLSEDYKQSSDCFNDANLIQQKCSKLRECCPNFDNCREETMDISLEQAIISKTAQLNEDKQNCLKLRAREAFKKALRGLFGKSGQKMLHELKQGELGLDVIRGARVLARLR
ncbi:hypothetical protein DICVIV_11277 [Dictyocaulus viviparus]|uniref:Uncharacterized protein n=1 Tax=Dictyocaulus viviparus TaxID=29172 RepID=A0A0D8XG98_DICVI|nr:hypothetical protein DICVIV_11277 [Dictyocaulus viviparus]